MFSYAYIRNRIIAKAMLQDNQELITQDNIVYKPESFTLQFIPFDPELAQSPDTIEEYQL